MGNGTISRLWGRKGVADTLTSRASMIFCGYWNSAYADPFLRRIHADNAQAYHGPVPLPEERAANLFNFSTPHEIAFTLRSLAKILEPEARFNHQNAWDRGELDLLLSEHAFFPLASDGEVLCRVFREISDIRSMQDISMYRLAIKLPALQ